MSCRKYFFAKSNFIRSFTGIFSLLFLAACSGCATTSCFNGRYSGADKIALEAGFKKTFIKTNPFTLTSYYRFGLPGRPLTVYIEGDGAAWETERRLSRDPTPRNPLVLKLASLDPSLNVAYIARPGQYADEGYPACDPAYWSDSRFSNTVVESMNRAIDDLLNISQSEEINLMGYSGGAAVAALIAARRQDVLSLTTIAGNLDSEAVNKYHKVSPMKNSLNPIDEAHLLRALPQIHFIGAKDRVIPHTVTKSFVDSAGNPACARIVIIEGAAHADGWIERWPDLISHEVYKGSGLHI